MVSLKPQIGKRSGSYRDTATPEKIAAFCKAVGAASNLKAPPTFLTLFRQGEFDLLQSMGIPLSKVLHAEQEYRYESHILAGDCIQFQTQLTQVLEKQGKSTHMQFLTFETEIQAERNAALQTIGQSRTLIVVREG